MMSEYGMFVLVLSSSDSLPLGFTSATKDLGNPLIG